LWIGVENAESFLRFESCRGHFPDFDFSHAALVWRWSWGGKWRAWLRERAGKLIWFPDYDPAGLAIFSTHILSCRPDVHLLIPNDRDELLANGNRELFLRQESMLQSLPAHVEPQSFAYRLGASTTSSQPVGFRSDAERHPEPKREYSQPSLLVSQLSRRADNKLEARMNVIERLLCRSCNR
jgi:hypothetical protein